jgi:hypothetical protein
MGWLVDAILHALSADVTCVGRRIFNVATETRTVVGWAEFIQAHFPCHISVTAAMHSDERSYSVAVDRLAASGFHSDSCIASSLAELAHALREHVHVDPLTATAFHNIAVQRQHDFSVAKPMERVL